MAKGNQKRDGSALEFEAQLWAAADKMRGQVEIAAKLAHELDAHGKQLHVFKLTNYTAEKVRTLAPARTNCAPAGPMPASAPTATRSPHAAFDQ